MKCTEKLQLIMAQPERKCCKQKILPPFRLALIGLATWVAILLQPLAAQAQECVTQSQFLAGEFDIQATPCENLKAYQLAYCNRQDLTGRDVATLAATADFAEFLVPIWPEQAEAAITLADSGRLAALQDGAIPEGYSALFYLLYSRLLAALISQAQPSLNQDKLFAYREVEIEFFPYHLRGRASFFRRALQCTVRCGSEAIDAQRLTRSPVFLDCVG